MRRKLINTYTFANDVMHKVDIFVVFPWDVAITDYAKKKKTHTHLVNMKRE